ncbi:MAG TPA: BPSS1780 family membrane protein [Burkholderiales bacterium]|jgi:hypothetical protein|nr:BPSS1780 family membrane protein [Burkholderiales bacterium]
MRARRLDAAAGLRWIGEGFAVFRVAPVRQLALSLAFLFMLTLALSVPAAGFAVVWLLIPALLVGPHAIARAAARGARPTAELLFEGFRRNLLVQLRLGAVYLAGMALVLAASVPVDEGRFAQAMLGVARLEFEDLQNAGTQDAMLVVAGLQTLLLAALWYAPLLVAWAGLGAPKAVFFSAAAALINWRALLAYGIGMTLLFGFVLLLAIAGTALLGGSHALQANSAAFAVLWTMLPVWFASSYLSYRDVFEAENAPAGGPPESPKMAA